MNGGSFILCEFVDAEFNNSKFDRMLFWQVSFRNAKITDGYFEKPNFVDVDFSNADLKGTVFSEVNLSGDNNLRCKNHQICD